MKALVYLGPGAMEWQDAPDPVPGADEVLVATSASAICGSDLHGFREASPRRVPPLIMGHETVGRIAQVGTGVPDARVGERVVLKPIIGCGSCRSCKEGAINHCRSGNLVGRDLPGGFCERFTVPSSAAVPFDAPVSDEVATLIEPLANAVHVAARSVQEGDRVFVIGAGPIGVLMVRAAFLFGAERVMVTDLAQDRLRFARAQGAEVLSRDDDVAAAVVDVTDGEGADLVIDAVGLETTWDLGVRAVKPGGRIYEIGLGSGSGTLDFFAVLGKEASITGSYAWSDDDFSRSVELFAEGALDTTGWITTMPLADGQRAFEELVSGAGRFKVVLVP